MSRAVLFDIDGTLLDSGGAGGAALGLALARLFGGAAESIPPHELAGATDRGISRRLIEARGHDFNEEAYERFVGIYLEFLEARLADPGRKVRLMPGVTECLGGLQRRGGIVTGLLTGNVRRGADAKLRRLGLHDAFVGGAFGDDAEGRNLLGPIAMSRLSEKTGIEMQAGDAVVIGDTPKDVACARALGARCVAVATGVHGFDELRACDPWIVTRDLEELSADGRWTTWLNEGC